MQIRVKVTAGARKERFEEVRDGVFAAAVKEKAEQNLANARVRALVAARFCVPQKAVRIVSGHRSKSKLLDVIKS